MGDFTLHTYIELEKTNKEMEDYLKHNGFQDTLIQEIKKEQKLDEVYKRIINLNNKNK